MRHIPNILTGLRILMVGLFVILFFRLEYILALGVYILAVLTDGLDGYLARHFDWVSDLGKVLDPLADKLMLMATLICFCIKGWIPSWLASLVVCKELLLIAGGVVLYKRAAIVVHADGFGKAATCFFNAGIIATLCKNFWPWIERLSIMLILIAATLAIIALVHYSIKNVYSRKDEIINKRAT